MTSADTIGLVNQLIETSVDAELGYRTAAQHVRNTQLQTMFHEFSKQRAQFAQQLKAEVERLGGSAAESGSVAAALHRGWIDVKSALSGGDGSAIIAACDTGEDAAVAAYQRVVDMDISGQTRALVERQFRQIQEGRGHLHRLRQPHAATEYSKNDEVGRGAS